MAALKTKGLHAVFPSRGRPLGGCTFCVVIIMCKEPNVMLLLFFGCSKVRTKTVLRQKLSQFHKIFKKIRINIYANMLLTVPLCGHDTSFLMLRKVHTLRMFKKGMLRRIIKSNRGEDLGGCRTLRNEVLHNL